MSRMHHERRRKQAKSKEPALEARRRLAARVLAALPWPPCRRPSTGPEGEMKQCPHCGKNQFGSAVTCTSCRQPISSEPNPGARYRPSNEPRSIAPRSSAAVAGEDEAPSLNPLVLFGRCFKPSGRFSRAQFAIVYLGSAVAAWAAIFAVAIALAFLDAGEEASLRGTAFTMTAMIPFVLVAAIGGGVRRWHDLGKPGYYVLLWIVPCVNAVAVLYLLFAPGESEGGGRGMPAWAIAVLVAVLAIPGVGVVAAIAIPSLLRARVSANEAAAIGDVRAVLAAEAAYQRVNGGFYEGRLSCLASPGEGCGPGASGAAGFLGVTLAEPGPRHGYLGRLEPGPAPAETRPSSPSSVTAFAYVARPVTPGNTGVRSFCGDSTGLLCYNTDGVDIAVVDGACPRVESVCRPLP
jgi:type IV pilus assembly protein PilA